MRSPQKSTSGLRVPSPRSESSSFGLKLVCDAHASSNVLRKNFSATGDPNKRSRLNENVEWSHTGLSK